MTVHSRTPTGVERFFDVDQIIVSKTDRNGLITYVNDVFVRTSEFTESELMGAPHSILRHPAMPRCVFQLLWDTIQAGQEIFAYVVNMTRSGDHYWVLAQVSPTFGLDGRIVGYHSNRRVARRSAVEVIVPLYEALLAEEARHERKLDAVGGSTRLLVEQLRKLGKSYDEFIWSLTGTGETEGEP